MQEPRVRGETARLLKEAGFNWATDSRYVAPSYDLYDSIGYHRFNEFPGESPCAAPTLAHAAMWLREVHNLYIVVIPTINLYWTYKVVWIAGGEIETPPYRNVSGEDFNSYDDALEEGIKQVLVDLFTTENNRNENI